jgi:hypothetical protein
MGREDNMTQLPLSEYRSLRRLRTERETETARQRLEADLLESGWRLLYPGPKWLDRWDKMFEKKGRRVLTDEQGCFAYKLQGDFWRRHRGLVGYDLGRVLDLFGRKGWQE